MAACATRRGPRSTARIERSTSPGAVARSSNASTSSWALGGSGRASQRSASSALGAGSGAVSNSTLTMSTPEIPSTSAWWVLLSSAKRGPFRSWGEALDEPQLPERLVAVERLGEHAARQRAQLVVVPGRG